MSEHVHEHSAPGHNHDYVSANEAHFDAEAKNFDARPEARELAKRVCNAIRAAYPDLFDENKTEVMDFACGSGVCISNFSLIGDVLTSLIRRTCLQRAVPLREIHTRHRHQSKYGISSTQVRLAAYLTDSGPGGSLQPPRQ